MARPKRPARLRTVERRTRAANEKLARAKNRLLDLAPGGTPDHPLDVPTAAVVEPKAKAVACPRCDELFDVDEHEAHTGERGRLREAKVHCRACGFRRSLWFRIVPPS